MRHVSPSWNFYIARPGDKPQDCIDWEGEGIKISGLSHSGEWVEFNTLIVEPGAIVRIEFPTGHSGRSTHVVVFSWASNVIPSDVPIHHLKARRTGS